MSDQLWTGMTGTATLISHTYRLTCGSLGKAGVLHARAHLAVPIHDTYTHPSVGSQAARTRTHARTHLVVFKHELAPAHLAHKLQELAVAHLGVGVLGQDLCQRARAAQRVRAVQSAGGSRGGQGGQGQGQG